MPSQYFELQPTNSSDRLVSWAHPSKFQRVSRKGIRNFRSSFAPRHLYSAGQPSCFMLGISPHSSLIILPHLFPLCEVKRTSYLFCTIYVCFVFLLPPCVVDADIILLPCDFFLLSFCLFFSSPNLSRRRLDVYHSSTHGVALEQI